MPTYEYICDACGHSLELFQSISESPKRKCPSCGRLKLRRIIGTGAGIIFKGGGFYQTDYRSDSYKKGAEADEKARTDKKTKGEGTKPGGKSDKKAAGDSKNTSAA